MSKRFTAISGIFVSRGNGFRYQGNSGDLLEHAAALYRAGIPNYALRITGKKGKGALLIYRIGWHDLVCELVPVVVPSTSGVPQTHWVKAGMPQIPKRIINSVFYLYANVEDAKTGRNPGGTGFIVAYNQGILSERQTVFYGVTNWHVACDGGFSTIRINKKNGGTDIIELDPAEWEFIPGKFDVAVVPITLDDDTHDVAAVDIEMFVSGPNDYRSDIGIGEDVFMIGIFVDHSGEAINIPSARFGNISMLPDRRATIRQPTRYNGVSYIIDMHSRTGFSGSPVYVYRTFGSDLSQPWGERFEGLDLEIDSIELDRPLAANQRRHASGRVYASSGKLRYTGMLKLLGINWGQFPEQWELEQGDLKESTGKSLVVNGRYVKGLSGMTCVIPAWHILEVLESDAVKKQRGKIIEELKARDAGKIYPIPERGGVDNND